MNRFDLSLYLVTNQDLAKGRSILEVVKQAVEGGVTMVQLREKDASTLDFYRLALEFSHFLKPRNIPLIINDRMDIALAVDAEGLHIGQSDLPYDVARKFLGKNKILGLSVETLEQAKEANSLPVDYIGLSPVFTTPTKTELEVALGLEGVKKICNFSKHPTVAIGGMNKNTVAETIVQGVNGVAVVSAIMSADNPKLAAQELKTLIDNERTDF